MFPFPFYQAYTSKIYSIYTPCFSPVSFSTLFLLHFFENFPVVQKFKNHNVIIKKGKIMLPPFSLSPSLRPQQSPDFVMQSSREVDEIMDAFDDLWILLAPTYRP